MGFEYLNDDLNIVQTLSNRPSETEPDELSPQEFKAKFDEAANIIQRYINEGLIPSITAGNVPCKVTNVTGDTVAEALVWLKEQINTAQTGKLGEKVISLAMLTDEVVDILNSGIPVVSSEAPSGNYPVGQIWLKTNADGAMETMYIKVSATEWVAYTFDVLPINRGGTGLDRIETGSMLYGNNGNLEKLAAPAENSFLHFGTKPEWKDKQATKQQLGFLTVATGTYTGTGEEREIVLVPNGDGTETGDNENAISPVFICVYNKDINLAASTGYYRAESSVCICNGAWAHTRRNIGGAYDDLCVVGLSESKLLFENIDGNNNGITTFMNNVGHTYGWTALY